MKTERELPTGLDDSMGWLLGQVFHAHLTCSQEALADFPGTQRGYMVVNAAANGCARNQIDMANQLRLDRTVMVYLVDQLVAAGLVERVPDPNDRRSRIIVATDDGRARLAEATQKLRRVDDHVFGALGAEERRRFRDMLQRVTAHHLAGGGDAHEACAVAAAAMDN
ncbi:MULTISPECIES: MarR family winged helix-turn-helix transcriptional regulator [Nonomuraea]|uniref:MarR family winged helix-turn-helix transcriptional regulator n=1 Tax=Nonomuraea mangrovi TaxID=2316207 RepID=A0ABW4SVD8_9ACTN